MATSFFQNKTSISNNLREWHSRSPLFEYKQFVGIETSKLSYLFDYVKHNNPDQQLISDAVVVAFHYDQEIERVLELVNISWKRMNLSRRVKDQITENSQATAVWCPVQCRVSFCLLMLRHA